MTLMSRNMNLQISLELKKEVGTKALDGDVAPSCSKEIED